MGATGKYARITLSLLAIAGGLASTGCAMRTVTRTDVQEVIVPNTSEAPGVVEYVWEEPMVDVVEIPPGLDPEGHYYRPAHQEVLEIRQGRWNYYKANKD